MRSPAELKQSIACPFCGTYSLVTDSRPTKGTNGRRRRRQCANENCKHRFTTYEYITTTTIGPVTHRGLLNRLKKCLGSLQKLADLEEEWLEQEAHRRGEDPEIEDPI